MNVKDDKWGDRDKHNLLEHHVDFNEWLDSEDTVGEMPGSG